MQDDLKSLIEARSKISERIWRIENAAAREEAEKYVGQCFKTRNTYGSSSKAWWLYRRIVSTDKSGTLRAIMFEVDCYGELRLSKHQRFSVGHLSGDKRITRAEFDRAAYRALAAAKIIVGAK